MRDAFRRAAALAAFALSLASGHAHAQTLYGSVVGTITDPSGAAVPGAKVVIVNTETAFTRQASSDDRGAYLFSDLQPGVYEVKVTASGFPAFQQTGIQVSVNAAVRVEVQLALPSATETITVAGSAVVLQSETAEVKSEMTVKELQDLPMLGNNYQTLFQLVEGFSPPRRENSITSTPQEGYVSNVNGTVRSTNNTRIDGASNVHIWLPQHAAYIPPREAIESVNVVTNSLNADQGLAGGAAIGVFIKSGTNQLHGVAFDYATNSVLNAKNVFYNQPKIPKNIQHQWGGTLGGPIKRNKLFFFGSMERTARRWNASQWITVVPANLRGGDFSAVSDNIYDPLTGNPDGTGRALFPDKVIPVSRQSRVARQIIGWLPAPTTTDTTSNYFAVGSPTLNRDCEDGKITWNASPKLTAFGRFGILNFDNVSPTTLGKQAGGGAIDSGLQNGPSEGRTISTAIGATYILTPSLLVDGSIGYARLTTQVITWNYGTNVGLAILKIPGTNGPQPFQSGIPVFSFGYGNVGDPGNTTPYFWHDNQYQYSMAITWTKGRHSVRAGVDISRQGMNHRTAEQGAGPRGSFSFTGGSTTLRGGTGGTTARNQLADFLLGLPNSVGKTVPVDFPVSTRFWGEGFYVSDMWQVSRKFTFSIGARFEFFPMPTRAHRGIERYDVATNKILIGGRNNVPMDTGLDTRDMPLSPRLGVAYRLSPKTVVRAGYGINVDPYSLSRPLRTNYPVVVDANFTAADTYHAIGTIEQGIPNIPVPDLTQGTLSIPGNVSAKALDNPFRRGYVESYNFTIQRELWKGLAGQVGYVGTRSIRPQVYKEANYAGPGEGTTGQTLYRQFGRSAETIVISPFGMSTYNSLQSRLERRFARGYSVRVVYTFSKAIAYNAEADGTLLFNSPESYGRNRSVTSYDRTHNFNVGWTAEFPFGKNKRWANQGLSRKVLGGWQFNGIFSRYSGTPFYVTSSGTSLNAVYNQQTADQVNEHVEKYGLTGPNQSYFDPTAFMPVTGVRFGNSGINILRGPGVTNTSASIFRQFVVSERVKVQFRAEAYNATNTPHFSNPSASASGPSRNPDGSIRSLNGFSTITSAASDQRQVRFALRVSF